MGNIAWKVPALAHFEIRNTGTQPLLVTGVYTDCACTVAAWDKQPIAPGATTTLTVTLDAETLGTFDKSVYVTTNAENVARRLRFSGRVMQKVVPDAPDEVLLVLDGSTGQNAFEQAKQFTAATEVNALAITKLDGTAKGGVVIGISDQFKIPVKYIGLGEGIEDLQLFRKKEFVDSLFGE